MVEKNPSKAKSKGNASDDIFGFKLTESSAFPQPQIKMLDGNFSNKERRQVVMKLIQFMKTT